MRTKTKMHANRLSVWDDIERCTFARTLVKFGILAAARNAFKQNSNYNGYILCMCTISGVICMESA